MSTNRSFATVVTVALLAAVAILLPQAAGADESTSTSVAQQVTIETAKPPGPVSGTFQATGAFVDSGTISNLSFVLSGFGAPTFLVSHITILFTSDEGTFTVKAQIKETLTSDPNVLTDSGIWTIVAGTGVYDDLRGHGTVSGTVDDTAGLITRTYEGEVHVRAMAQTEGVAHEQER